MSSVLILGRQPALGLAELESLYGSGQVRRVAEQAAMVDFTPDKIDFHRLGGSIKLTKLLTELDTVNWAQIEAYLHKTVPEHLKFVPNGKLTLGLSVYGLPVQARQLTITALALKKTIKRHGRQVRVVPNKEAALNAAQVLHNQLTSPNGWELVSVRSGAKTLLCQTTAIQDIEAYTARDHLRPKRDAKVGMLPPKLAQIIVNLAAGEIGKGGLAAGATVLDPFCGTGVLLQEALLMGYNAYGTDIDPRMIDFTQENLAWLKQQTGQDKTAFRLAAADATSTGWQAPFDTVAAEGFLGRPISAVPPPAKLELLIKEGNGIMRGFLSNLAKQTKTGFRLCVAMPAWQLRPGAFTGLPCLDELTDLGYTRLSFSHVSHEALIYARDNQLVARQLVVLIRK